MPITDFDYVGGDKIAWINSINPATDPNQFTTAADMNAIKTKLRQLIAFANGTVSYLHQSTFQGNDGTNITAYTPLAGNEFSLLFGTMAILGNKMSVKTVNGSGVAQAITDVGTSNFSAITNFEISNTSHHTSFPVKYIDVNNQLVVSLFFDQNVIRIYRVLNGTFSTVVDQQVSLNPTGVQKVEVIHSGNNTTIKYQDTNLATYTDSNLSANTKFGIGISMDGGNSFAADVVKFISLTVV